MQKSPLPSREGNVRLLSAGTSACQRRAALRLQAERIPLPRFSLSSPASTTTSAATTGSAAARSGRTCGGTGPCGRTRSRCSATSSAAMMGTADTRRIAMWNRPRMMPTRRRWRRRTPRVHDDRVLHHDRLFERFDARPVAMGAEGRPVGMRDDLHAVADRAERTVDVASVDPRAGRHAAGRKGNRRSRQNRREVLVHDPPPFPFYRKQGDPNRRI